MYKYKWDVESGGYILTSDASISGYSNELRPVYSYELDILGFDKFWVYPKNNDLPIMWCEHNNYYYRGVLIAKTNGGSLYNSPELVIVNHSDISDNILVPVDMDLMLSRNSVLLEALVQDTIQKIYNNYYAYRNYVDVFYTAFSGGKDSVVALDLVQRAIPHDDFLVLFGDTLMELPDTYEVVEKVMAMCEQHGIKFYKVRSKFNPNQSWKMFGPPSITCRWCCSVHKTSPQVNFLRSYTGKHDFSGMAFTGIRAAESPKRNEYDDISEGKKHAGQMSFHCIHEWNSAELFLYIYSRNLILNEAYKKGIARVGCIVCPNSTGKHEYLKHLLYPEIADNFLDLIVSTSSKTNYSTEEMKAFIDNGYWKTRKSGQELNFGQDLFEVFPNEFPPRIVVYRPGINWTIWLYTIGEYHQVDANQYIVKFDVNYYQVELTHSDQKITFKFPNCGKSRIDTRFFSLFRGVIIKSLYCVGCGECEAECKNNCIDMSKGIKISSECRHCGKCHDINEHCLRYDSIRNKLSGGGKMTGLDRYLGFGLRADWLDIYCKYEGKAEFWSSDGDGYIVNKKKDAFRSFLIDAGLSVTNKEVDGDKFMKLQPTYFAEVVSSMGAYSDAAWALILCNMVYVPTYNWFVKNLHFGVEYTPDSIKMLLEDVMPNDLKGLGKRNVVDSLKIAMHKTPLGTSHIFAECEFEEKSAGVAMVSMNSLRRCTWTNPISEVILYSLYKFAEECGGSYQFTLDYLIDDSVERGGVSPSRIFGLSYDVLKPLLNGLAVNYPKFISTSFTFDLNTITLCPNGQDYTSEDILKLFK